MTVEYERWAVKLPEGGYWGNIDIFHTRRGAELKIKEYNIKGTPVRVRVTVEEIEPKGEVKRGDI